MGHVNMNTKNGRTSNCSLTQIEKQKSKSLLKTNNNNNKNIVCVDVYLNLIVYSMSMAKGEIWYVCN